MLIVVGALAANRELSAVGVLAVAVVASLLADSLWYGLGRLQGNRILKRLCQISLSPDSCVRQTESVFERWGMPALLVAKFIPGFSTVAPPMAGAMQGGTMSFLLYDTGGTSMGRARDPRRIKGAAMLDVDDLDTALKELPRDRESSSTAPDPTRRRRPVWPAC